MSIIKIFCIIEVYCLMFICFVAWKIDKKKSREIIDIRKMRKAIETIKDDFVERNKLK